MAHFYASIQGNHGEATRMGTAQSGISGHIRGWEIGAFVACYVDRNGIDVVEIYLTDGSNGVRFKLLGRYTRAEFDALVG